MKVRAHYIFIAVAIVVIIGTLTMFFIKIQIRSDTDRITLQSIDDVPEKYWDILAEKKVFFGHQSVGYNIIEGINDILNNRDYIKLNIAQTTNPADFDRAIFAHSPAGTNTDPHSKIKSFKDTMDSGVGDKVDMAFFKFCYVDITRDSDPKEILDTYRATIEDLERRHPHTKFLHITVPLKAAPKGAKRNLKEWVKSLIGKPCLLDDNLVRQHYNTLLKDAYSKTESVFDLALFESVNPDGFRYYTKKANEKVFLLAGEYTEDGGHLNEQGRRRIAEQLLIFIAQIAGSL